MKLQKLLIMQYQATRIDQRPERYNEALLKKTNPTLKKNDDVMKKLNIAQIKSKFRCPSEPILTNLFVETKT